MKERRIDSIYNLLKVEGKAEVSQLCQRFGVSPATIRRDLSELESANLIVRSYGNAQLLCKDSAESSFAERKIENLDAKQQIAEKVLPYLEQCQSIYVDGSTTCTELVKMLPNSRRYTVFTNSNASLQILKELDQVNTFVIGGFLAADQNTFDGDQAISIAKGLFMDVSLLSCSGFCATGFVNSGLCGSYIKRIMQQNCERCFLLADKSKYKKRGTFSLGTWDNVDMLFTDAVLDREDQEAIEQKNVKIVDV